MECHPSGIDLPIELDLRPYRKLRNLRTTKCPPFRQNGAYLPDINIRVALVRCPTKWPKWQMVLISGGSLSSAIYGSYTKSVLRA